MSQQRNTMTAKKATAMARLLVNKGLSAYGANKWNFAWMLNKNQFLSDSAFRKVRLAFYSLALKSAKYSAMEKMHIQDKFSNIGG